MGRLALFAGLLVVVGCGGGDPAVQVDASLDATSPSETGAGDAGSSDVSSTADADVGTVSACDAAKQARAALAPGTYKPDSTNTGPLPCVPLTPHVGDLAVNVAGTVVEGLDITGSIVLGKTATNVIVRNCIIRGPGSPPPQDSAAVIGGATDVTYNRLGIVFEDSRFDLTGREDWFLDTIEGANITLRRTEILRGVDGVGLVSEGGNVTVEGCWIHDGYWTSWTDATPQPKPSQPDNQTHNDGIQFHRGKNYVVRGNFIGGDRKSGKGTGDDYNNSCLMISQGVDSSAANKLDNVLIEKNWFEGGAASINLFFSNANDLSGVTIQNNRFLRSSGYYILVGTGTNPKLSNNVFDDDNSAVTIHYAP